MFSYVGEDGLNISGGQKQRLGIVRALVANASILILDEATNSLDDKTEENFFEVLNDLNEELTIISINHKLKNKSFFDHIYHLDKKKLVKIKLSRSYLDSCMEECDFSRKEIAQNIADKTNSILVDYVGLTVCLARKGW